MPQSAKQEKDFFKNSSVQRVTELYVFAVGSQVAHSGSIM